MSDDDRRPVLLGEAPSKGGDRYHAFPLSGPPARVLCTLAGIPPQAEGSTYGKWTWALYERFECRNVFERYAEATPWSAPKAREALEAALAELDGRVIVCLGRRVQAALYSAVGVKGDVEFYRWENIRHRVEVGLTLAVAVPHPSGLNRLLNDSVERERAGAVLRRAMSEADA